jgi:hypothetical protein
MQGAPLEIGEQVDSRYRVISLLGQGGMGAVYGAEDLQTGAPVAVKVLVESAAGDAEALARFEREAQLAAQVGGAGGVVPVHALGEHRGNPYFVMDLVEGRDLGVVFREGSMEPRALAALLADVARTLEGCHRAGVVHRDLKPENVIVREHDGRPLVADFGLAQGGAAERLTRTGQLLGTPAYMSPEQARTGERVGPATDVYSLGAILYHGSTGRLPFEGKSVLGILAKVISDDPVAPSKVADVPEDLDAVCLKALEKAPEHRYASAGALAEDLERLARGEPVGARPVSGIMRYGRRLARRERRAVAQLVAIVGVLALGGVFAAAYWVPAQQARAQLDEGADLRGLASLIEIPAEEHVAELARVREQIARLVSIEVDRLDSERRVRRADALGVLRAHERYLRPGARGVRPRGRKLSQVETLVDVLLLAANGKSVEAYRRMRVLESESIRGLSLLRERLTRHAVRSSVGKALDDPKAAVARLKELAKGAPAEAFKKTKQAALEELAHDFKRRLTVVARDEGIYDVLGGIGAVCRSAPGVRPGPKLSAALNEVIDLLVSETDERYPQSDTALHVIRVEALVYSKIDSDRTPSADYLKFLGDGFGKSLRERALARMRCGFPVLRRSPPTSLKQFATLRERYPRSQTIQYWYAWKLRCDAETLGLGKPDSARAYARAAVECRKTLSEDAGLLNDLNPVLVNDAHTLLAQMLVGSVRHLPKKERKSTYEEADRVLAEIRDVVDGRFLYLSDLARVDGQLQKALVSAEQGRKTWERYLKQSRAYQEKITGPDGILSDDPVDTLIVLEGIPNTRRYFGHFLLDINDRDGAIEVATELLDYVRGKQGDRSARALLAAAYAHEDKDWEAAVELLKTLGDASIAEKPEMTKLLARGLWRAGDRDGARKCIARGLVTRPQHPLLVNFSKVLEKRDAINRERKRKR